MINNEILDKFRDLLLISAPDAIFAAVENNI